MGAGASATASDDWDDEKRLHATPGRGLPAMNAVESNALQTEVHKLVGLEKLTYWRNDKGEDGGRVFGGGAGGGVPVFISYATGNREIDDPGAGPGIEMCHAIVKALHAKGIPCWTGLVRSFCSPPACPPAACLDSADAFPSHPPTPLHAARPRRRKLGGVPRQAEAGQGQGPHRYAHAQHRSAPLAAAAASSDRPPSLLTPLDPATPVIQTQDFYKSRPCMKELFTAFDKKDPNLKVLPLRFELTVKGEDNPDKADKEAQWPNEEKDKPVLGEKKHENLPNNHDVFTKEDLTKWEDDKGEFATRRTLVQKELGNINSMPSRGVMSLDPAVEGMEGVSGIAGYVLEVLTEGMNAWEKKGYMARLKGMETRKNLDTREKADLDKKIYFSSGRNLMPYRDNGNKDTEVGFSAMLANTNIVIALLEEGGDPSGHGEMGNYAIHWAIGKQCDDCVFALIGGGADIQKKGFMIQSGLLVLGAVGSQMPCGLRCCLLTCFAGLYTLLPLLLHPLTSYLTRCRHPPQFMGRRTPLDLALRPYGHGIIPRSAPLVNFLKERGAGCGCAKGDCEMGAECLSKLTEADNAQTPITDIEDEELKQWLVVLLDDSYGKEVYNMFVKKRDTPADAAADYVEYVPINMQTLVTMATSAASTADLAAHLKNMLPDLASPACKKIAEKAAEDATKGKLSEIEIR